MICNEKEQVKQGKIQNAQFKEKWGTRKWNGAKSCVQGDKQIKEKLDVRWNKGYGDLWAKPHSAKLPTCEKELKKSSGLDVVMHTFDPSNVKVELEACLVYRQWRKPWRTESWWRCSWTGVMFQSQPAAELGSFSQLVLTLETRIEERGYRISLHD